MRRKNLHALILLFLLAPLCAHAQSVVDEYKFEVGGQVAALGVEDYSEPLLGVGGRVGYNFNKYLALEGEANFFPSDAFGNDQIGQRAQAFVGLKAGARSRYAGLFAKARPGVMFIGETTSGFSCSRFPGFTSCRPSHNNFALDAGAVAEFYPTRRSIIRLDVGDTMVNARRATRDIFSQTSNTTSNLIH
ncbi:MAG TPA: outer membrane beta-barrel protein, partial [Pyrinomonadaceae bacterium]